MGHGEGWATDVAKAQVPVPHLQGAWEARSCTQHIFTEHMLGTPLDAGKTGRKLCTFISEGKIQ